ncbi:MAG: class F sortase, partial [Hamadaea sp.]|nr:class F sortase [Hamadaea sp.]
PSGSAPPGSATAPSRVRIPAIAVDAPIGPLHREHGGRLAAPRSYDEAGWYAEGPIPGSPGPAVLAGHVDSTRGAAVFHGLRRLHAGDRVEVLVGAAWVAFRVTAVRRVPKAEFPTAAVYGPTPDAQLRLITCGGEFDRSARSYLDNVVVFATAG